MFVGESVAGKVRQSGWQLSSSEFAAQSPVCRDHPPSHEVFPEVFDVSACIFL